MIHATASGYLGNDCVLRQTGDSSFLTFNLASNERYKGEERTLWIDCSYRFPNMEKFLTKGRYVTVAGSLSQRTYTTQNNEQRTVLTLYVDRIELGPKPPELNTQYVAA